MLLSPQPVLYEAVGQRRQMRKTCKSKSSQSSKSVHVSTGLSVTALTTEILFAGSVVRVFSLTG